MAALSALSGLRPNKHKNRKNFQGRLPDEFAPSVKVTDEQRRVVFMAAALLLDYPEDNAPTVWQVINDQLGSLPAQLADKLRNFTSYASSTGVRDLQQDYVATFDQRRKCSLFLSYYAVGDTRERGTAILAFRRSLTDLGFEQVRDELPDHLCVLLEAAAQADVDGHATLTDILASHRDGLEVLRTALSQIHEQYADVVTAVCSALPAVDEAVAVNYRSLIRSGPPAELVGLGMPGTLASPAPYTGMENQP